jgi:Flp pilus assembly protein TadG
VFNRRRWSREDGVLTVELAVIFPVLAVLIFGTIEFGITLSREEQWVSAARDGARYAAVKCQPDTNTGCTTTLIEQRIANSMCSGSISCLTPGTPTLYVGNTAVAANYCSLSTNGTPNTGTLVTLKWPQNVHTLAIPFFPNWTVTLTTSGSFRCGG